MIFLTGTTGIIMSVLTSAIKMAAKFVPGVNPRAVEFVCHYIGGTQTPMTLNLEELEFTAGQVRSVLAHWTRTGDEFTESGGYDPVTGWGWCACTSGEWLSHVTKGVVGGFIFHATLSDIEGTQTYVVKCHDEWDFNPNSGDTSNNGGARLEVPKGIPALYLLAAKKAAQACGVPIRLEEGQLFVNEDDLVQFNEKHRFSTDWSFNLVKVGHPYYWVLPQYQTTA